MSSAARKRISRLGKHLINNMSGEKVEEVGNVQASPASDSASRAGLAKLNAMSVSDACDAFTACCSSPVWAKKFAAKRPFTSVEHMLEAADATWWKCGAEEWRAGFEGHHRLGKKAAEQRTAMSAADAATLASLESAVAAYEAKFGFACIIYAPGKSADVLLAIAQRRLGNAVDTELRVAAEQVSMITRYRLENLAYAPSSPPSRGDGRSPVTTHILDTALGRPGAGVSLQLQIQGTDGTWRPLGSGVTNSDGRVADLLPPTYNLRKGIYRVLFAVGGYFARQGTASFFPEVTIAFKIEAPTEHYHVPLLLSPHGYTTYRGS